MAEHNGARATDWGRLRRSDLCVLSAGSPARCASEHRARGHPPGARFRDFEFPPCLIWVNKWLTPEKIRKAPYFQSVTRRATTWLDCVEKWAERLDSHEGQQSESRGGVCGDPRVLGLDEYDLVGRAT
jgi:hypothetical protein